MLRDIVDARLQRLCNIVGGQHRLGCWIPPPERRGRRERIRPGEASPRLYLCSPASCTSTIATLCWLQGCLGWQRARVHDQPRTRRPALEWRRAGALPQACPAPITVPPRSTLAATQTPLGAWRSRRGRPARRGSQLHLAEAGPRCPCRAPYRLYSRFGSADCPPGGCLGRHPPQGSLPPRGRPAPFGVAPNGPSSCPVRRADDSSPSARCRAPLA